MKIIQKIGPTHGLRRVKLQYEKELAASRSFKKSLRSFKGMELRKGKIQIGGGSHSLEGFFNVDIFPPADLIWDVREGLPFVANSASLIFSEHFFEHIDYPVSAKKFIFETYRILKNGGRVIIGVPDGGLILRAYVKRDMSLFKKMIQTWYKNRDFLGDINTYIDLVNYHFRDQDNSIKYNPHFWSYDFEKLKSLLFQVGFTNIKKWKFDKRIANPKRKFGSLYVVATK